MHQLLNLVEKIPSSFWGIVIGSLFSLGGVWISNRANDRRLRAQVMHDRDLRLQDREFSLRRDIYLMAIEGLSAGLTAIPTLQHLEVPTNQVLEAYNHAAPSIAKVHLIGSIAAVDELSIFFGELTSVFVSLSVSRNPLVEQMKRIAILQERMVSLGKERDAMLQMIKQFNLDGEENARRWNVLNQNFTFEQERIAKALAEHSALTADLYAKRLSYGRECAREHLRLNRLSVPLLLAVRAELNLPINEGAYKQIFDGSARKQEAIHEAMFDRFISDAKNATANSTQNG